MDDAAPHRDPPPSPPRSLRTDPPLGTLRYCRCPRIDGGGSPVRAEPRPRVPSEEVEERADVEGAVRQRRQADARAPAGGVGEARAGEVAAEEPRAAEQRVQRNEPVVAGRGGGPHVERGGLFVEILQDVHRDG